MFVLLLLSLITLVKCQEVSVSNGKITVPDTLKCDITIYNFTLHNVTNELPVLYYGLIAYDCSNESNGYLISKPKCSNRGVMSIFFFST